jgi:hypothetical protein
MALVQLLAVPQDFVRLIYIALFRLDTLALGIPSNSEVLVAVCTNEKMVCLRRGGSNALEEGDVAVDGEGGP